MYCMPDIHADPKKSNKTRKNPPSIYNQRAKNGFKYWIEGDPNVNNTSCKYQNITHNL
jgi:hypothetical protein